MDAVIATYNEKTPQLDGQVFVAPTAAVIGDVVIGAESSIWYGAVVRGDVMPIRIGARTSVQDGTVIHVTSGRFGTTIGDNVTIGHRAVVHACTIGDGALIGMGAIILDGAVVEEGALVGAGAVVTPGTVIPKNMLAVGTPARPKRPLTAEEEQWLAFSASHYVELTQTYLAQGLGG